jgi:UDP-N-acetylglucosamine transferase subunit ALG13
VIFVGVGTFIGGFDALVAGADRAAGELGIDGFAQVGNSRITPRHLRHARFLAPQALTAQLQASRVAVCHAGMGLIGDALRAGCRLVLVPRQGATNRRHPANDQRAFAERLALRLPLHLCLEPEELTPVIAAALTDTTVMPELPASSVPAILRGFLVSTTAPADAQSRPASSS